MYHPEICMFCLLIVPQQDDCLCFSMETHYGKFAGTTASCEERLSLRDNLIRPPSSIWLTQTARLIPATHFCNQLLFFLALSLKP